MEVLSRAFEREDVPAVRGTQPRERHAAAGIAIGPAIRSVGLIILTDGRAQLDAACFQRGEEPFSVPDPVLDLNLAHCASA